MDKKSSDNLILEFVQGRFDRIEDGLKRILEKIERMEDRHGELKTETALLKQEIETIKTQLSDYKKSLDAVWRKVRWLTLRIVAWSAAVGAAWFVFKFLLEFKKN